MGAGIAVIGALTWALQLEAQREEAAAARASELRASSECAGPRSLANPSCTDSFGPAYDVVMSKTNDPIPQDPECTRPPSPIGDMHVCDYSGGDPDAPTVWIIGDSHANHWQAALAQIGRERGWRITSSYFAACPAANVDYVGWWGTAVAPEATHRCSAWQESIQAALIEAHPDAVFTSAYTRGETVSDGTDRSQTDQYIEGFRTYWASIAEMGTAIFAIADVPLNETVRDLNCVALNPNDPILCAVPRNIALPADPIVAAAKRSPDVTLIDLTANFCDDTLCYAVIGGMPVYYDINHINRSYIELLAPELSAAIPSLAR